MAHSYCDLEARVLEVYGFLARHRTLFDAHSVDFFTAGHWENVVPEEWQLLSQQLPPDEAFLSPRQHRHAGLPDSLYQFLVDCSDFRLPGLLSTTITTSDGGHRNATITSRDEITAATSVEGQPNATITSVDGQTNIVSVDGQSHTTIASLHDTITTTLLASRLPVCEITRGTGDEAITSLGRATKQQPNANTTNKDGGWDDQCGNTTLDSFAMKAKKSHEVCQFSKVIAKVMSNNHLTQVLDIGSGKGYLSEYLALHFGYTVVGVDSQQINTDGACKRNAKVSKVWKRVGKKEFRKKSTPSPSMSFNNEHTANNGLCLDTDLLLENLFLPKTPHPGITGGPGKDGDTTTNPPEDGKVITNPQEDGKAIKNPQEDKEAHTNQVVLVKEPLVSDDSVVEHLNKDNSAVRGRCDHTESERGSNSTFYPLTMELRPDTVTEFLQAAEQKSMGEFKSSRPFCLVGLHTCGDLCSTALRLFAEVCGARALCVVGCCYHHITESSMEDAGFPMSSVLKDAGFPMSSVLRGVGASIGRKGRMLACQTANKFTETTSGQTLDRTYWRALLQVFIARVYPDIFETRSKEIIVGRLKSFPSDFLSYARIALTKVGITDEKISDMEFLLMEEEFRSKKKNLEAYLKCRGVLAPVIESLIILDRLLYLKEQEVVNKARLSMLFDPNLSPRCTGIIAQKIEM